LAYFEVEIRGPKKDLHSGLFGGSVHNPAQVLCELIAGMHDAEGRVTLPGFYDSVRALTADERAALARLPYSDERWKEVTGVPNLWGEKGYTTLERVGARPTLEVNGFLSGFTGEGSKTVLPARAMAKISTRLVADQDPAAVHQQLCEYLRRNCPDTVVWEIRELVHGKGAIMDRTSPWMRAAGAALREVFGREPIFKRDGGSVPVVGMMQEKLGVDSVMLGFALPDDGIHGPNERQYLPNFYRGIETYIRFLGGLSK
jgi:acetylornithine deacetylase/succinyl-diaminopimelate desuccinylase-like protein